MEGFKSVRRKPCYFLVKMVEEVCKIKSIDSIFYVIV